MRRRTTRVLLAASAILIAPPGRTDDVTAAEQLLCSTLQATVCLAQGGCAVMPPADLNIPQFIEVDVKARTLSTTAASGENRVTAAASVQHTGDGLVLQGYEAGRAFSLLIEEATGQASFASVARNRSVIVFAACTPAPGS